MKRIVVCVGFLVVVSCLLLQVASANNLPPSQLVGQVCDVDSSCGSGCSAQDIYVSWDNSGNVYFQYVPQGCCNCAQGGTNLTCSF